MTSPARFFPLAVVVLALAGCGDDRHGSDGCTMLECRSGVAIDLGRPQITYADSLPLAIHVCFDASCDDVTLSSTRDGIDCGGMPGVGAPDQLTSCFVNNAGGVEIDIGRTDGRSYADGASHTIAISYRDLAGHVVHESAKSIVLPAAYPNGPTCGPVCYQGSVSLD